MCGRLSRVQERRARQSQSQPHSPGHNRSNEVVLSSSQPFNNPVGKDIEASESPSHASDRIQDEERNGLEIAAAALGQPEGVGQVPFYTGTRHLYPTLIKTNMLIVDRRPNRHNINPRSLLSRTTSPAPPPPPHAYARLTLQRRQTISSQ